MKSNNMKRYILSSIFYLCGLTIFAQSLPQEYYFSNNNQILNRGGQASTGFYDEQVIDTLYLYFDQQDYWTQLQDNYCDKINILSTLIYKGETFDSIGVRFKGQTSYLNTTGEGGGGGPGGGSNNVYSDKKSFNIELDWVKNHDIDGYETINLNNCFGDPSFIREVLFENISRNYIPATKANYVQLVINDESWGLYPSIQQLDKKHASQWFFNDECTRWRAEDPNNTAPGCGEGPGGGGGGPGSGPHFGAGTSSLNYLGSADEDYYEHYTLKKSYKEDPWADLINACQVIDQADEFQDPYQELNESLDVDATLWHLANEIIFSDDDSYIFKGGMDYYVYFDEANQRILPIEYDGNSVMASSHQYWSPFYHEEDPDFILLNKLLAIPELRARYLAHFRTILNERFQTNYINTKIDDYAAFIDEHVQNDPKKIYSHQEFMSELASLKIFFQLRAQYLWDNSEVNQADLQVDDVEYVVEGIAFSQPNATQEVEIRANLSNNTLAVDKINLYYGTGLSGRFDLIEMTSPNNDAQYTVTLPAQTQGEYVRFYIEAIGGNGSHSYMPSGAEHQVYTYRVSGQDLIIGDVVINEFMASNSNTIADELGEYDDWVELYNNGSEAHDISGYFLSDKVDSLNKWTFPEGSIIEADSYLTVWLDKDPEQGAYHANFKLSANGEALFMCNTDLTIVDEIYFSAQSSDISYGRYPNGTGDFNFLDPSYGQTNNLIGIEELTSSAFSMYPNPSSSIVNIKLNSNEPMHLVISNLQGQILISKEISGQDQIDISSFSKGVYFVSSNGNSAKKLIVNH